MSAEQMEFDFDGISPPEVLDDSGSPDDRLQSELDFDSGSEEGYSNWQLDNKRRTAKISSEWAVPINKNVRVKLKNIPKEVEGFLALVEYPKKMNHRLETLKLRLNCNFKDFELTNGKANEVEFSSHEIETLILLE